MYWNNESNQLFCYAIIGSSIFTLLSTVGDLDPFILVLKRKSKKKTILEGDIFLRGDGIHLLNSYKHSQDLWETTL